MVVVFKVDVEDFDYVIGSKLVYFGFIVFFGLDSIKNSSDDDIFVFDNVDKFVDSFRVNMVLCEGINVGNYIDFVVFEGQWFREVGSVEIVVSISLVSDIEYIGVKVNVIDVFSIKFSQVNVNKVSIVVSIEDYERGIIDFGIFKGVF